jgi:pilus assembly protein CpaB
LPARTAGTLWLALRSISDANAKEPASDEPTRKRGESISVIRCGVPSQMTAQK